MQGVVYLPENYISEILLEYGPDIISDSIDLAETLWEVFQEDYQNAAADEMQEILFYTLETMTASEWYDFINNLWQINLASQIQGIPLPSYSTAAAGSAGVAKASAKAGSAAAAQLLQLIQNPDLLNNLHTLALGLPIRNRGPSMSVKEFLRLLSILVNKVAADADEILRESDDSPACRTYRQDYPRVNPTILEDRTPISYEALPGSESHQLTTSEAIPRQPWSVYFPFSKDTNLLVEYETSIGNFNIGNATVLERTPNLLRFKLHIDKWDQFNVPETEAVIAIEYNKEGTGNRANVVVNGETYDDNEVAICSGRRTRDISLSIRILEWQVDKIILTTAESDQVKLKFKTGGEEHVLILTKK